MRNCLLKKLLRVKVLIELQVCSLSPPCLPPANFHFERPPHFYWQIFVKEIKQARKLFKYLNTMREGLAAGPILNISLDWQSTCSRIILGTRLEVPPPCNFLMTRGGVGEVNNPAGGARGGGGVRGDEIFFFQEARRDWLLSILQPAFNLATMAFCSVKQALVVDSWVKAKVDKWDWLTGRPDLGWDEDFSRNHFHFLAFVVRLFFVFHQCLIRNRLVWKCSPKVK